MQLGLTEIEKKEWEKSLEKYAYIMQNVHSVNVSNNEDFQRTFNGFYRVRRNEEWRKSFYSLFEKSKTCQNTFKDIVVELHELTGFVEASFSSKLVATLNPDMPIWDQFVLQNLKLEPIKPYDKNKLARSIELYEKIVDWYCEFKNKDEAKEYVIAFDNMFPQYSWISSTKKIDFFLWKSREK